jgi:hypothetical protein
MDPEVFPFERPLDLRLVVFFAPLFFESEEFLVPIEFFLLPVALLLRLREPVEVPREEELRDDPLLPLLLRERDVEVLLRLLPERELLPREERLRDEPLRFSISS